MSSIDTVAAQRDEANMKLRKAIEERDAALKEVERLKAAAGSTQGGYVPPAPLGPPGIVHGEVPAVTPPQSKRPRIFGGKL